MDLERMLDKCRRGQWTIDQIDWTTPPRPMTRDEEIAVVQYFHDMAGIERLAKALFEEQRRRTRDPVLGKIFSTFIADEERHAQVAERLAAHYDVHRYTDYRINPDLVAFCPVFLDAIRHVSAEIANAYITTGELILDIALLRSLADFVADETCERAMYLINRDESRHIAIDYYMVGYYASPAYQSWLGAQPRRRLTEHARAVWTFAKMTYHASPFVRTVMVAPLRRLDPSNRRIREAFRRAQILGRKPEVARRPFSRFIRSLQTLDDTPVVGAVFGRAITRLAGVPGDVLTTLHDERDARRAADLSYSELAREACSFQVC